MIQSSFCKKFIELLESKQLANYCRHSRVHRLKDFKENYYVKRDDELSFGVTGSKMRKYLSLIPALKARHVQEAVLIGGASSNNIVGLSQILIEEQIHPTLFLCGRKPEKASGNLQISQLLVDEESIHWHSKDAWSRIEELAHEYAEPRKNCCVIEEGASCKESLCGAMTLGVDIEENEKQLGLHFDHIVCDAGTGMMACALILYNSMVKKNTHHHVVLMAEDATAFQKKLRYWQIELENLIGETLDELASITCYKPHNAPSFGAVNAGVRKEILRLARKEGILADPVYSAKLFAEARNMMLKGNVLLIHSGGGLGLR
jgi:1-aminocyclopropane-1-carboxylate deaminase